MLDAVLINDCADPSLKPAIVEQFVQAVGSADPLAISVKSGDRLLLVPRPKTPEEAIEIIRENIGSAVVRVGLTQFPAGTVPPDAGEPGVDLVDPCFNLHKGTAMFAKILRIVSRWYGNPTTTDVFPQLFEDAIHAWQTGKFEGESVFQANDPGGPIMQPVSAASGNGGTEIETVKGAPQEPAEPEKAGIRIDLTRIGGQK
ncbi:TraH family protein [Agrobacterium sp. V1]|uniref:TraH family protein n=1 Tax=Agrobacterium sp. V1 TaxID=3061957 RepID=UPI0026727FBC|nr:TraH family protein [Agrobacterium sp. V1]MDO3445445.1 TraH family protein [Agrobacterium sp. V1]